MQNSSKIIAILGGLIGIALTVFTRANTNLWWLLAFFSLIALLSSFFIAKKPNVVGILLISIAIIGAVIDISAFFVSGLLLFLAGLLALAITN